MFILGLVSFFIVIITVRNVIADAKFLLITERVFEITTLGIIMGLLLGSLSLHSFSQEAFHLNFGLESVLPLSLFKKISFVLLFMILTFSAQLKSEV